MIQRLLPFLNKLIPTALAVKGLGKIDPKLEKFFGAAAASGYTADSALDFVRNKIEGRTEANVAESQRLEQGNARGTLRPDEAASRQLMAESNRVPNAIQNVATLGAGLAGGFAALPGGSPQGQSQQQPQQIGQQQPHQQQGQPPQGYNPIAGILQKYPDLGRFMDQQINSGTDPLVAAGQAKAMKKFGKDIFNIEQEIGASFEDLISQLFGTQGQGQKTPQPGNAQAQLAALIKEYITKKRGK